MFDQERERHWAAGLFEGEGTVSTTSRRGGKRVRRGKMVSRGRDRTIYARVRMTDREPVERFSRYMGFGSITGPHHQPPTSHGTPRKPTWTWVAGGRGNVTTLQFLLGGLLGPRRQRQLDEAIADFDRALDDDPR